MASMEPAGAERAASGAAQGKTKDTVAWRAGLGRRRSGLRAAGWAGWAIAAAMVCAALGSAAQASAQSAPPADGSDGRWDAARANAWYARQPWLVGSDYVPKDAINQLEMWQAATFDPQEIDREMAMAEAIGMNTMRVFLHDLLWRQDPQGFQQRIGTFLDIAARHHIRPLLVLFDSCWDPNPRLGPQHPPIPGVHNSGWVQSPGIPALRDPSQYPRLEAYTKGVIGAFANDPRILGWDLWNEPTVRVAEPGGPNLDREDAETERLVESLLPQVFAWARAAHPSQPLTSGVFDGHWGDWSALRPVEKIQLSQSDIVTFHNYGWPEEFEERVLELKKYGRPVICTEYMARGAGSTFDTILPIALKYRVGAINWGFVLGKTQTNLPWDSWQRPYVLMQPTIWFHDIYYPDGRPYRQHEVDLIRRLTQEANGSGTQARLTP